MEHTAKKRIRVEITQDILDEIERQIERTGKGAAAILRTRRAKNPKKLYAQTISNWRSGRIKTANKSHLDYMLEAWAEEPDYEAPPAPVNRREVKPVIDFYNSQEGQASLRDLKAQIRRTKISPFHLFKIKGDAFPKTLTFSKVQNWLSGVNKTAEWSHFEIILNAYVGLDDWHPTSDVRRPHLTSQRVAVTSALCDQIKEHINRTGRSIPLLLKAQAPNTVPAGLNYVRVQRWLSGATKTAHPEHIDYIVSCYERLPDRTQAESGARMVITPSTVNRFRHMRERSGISPSQLLARFDETKPAGLSGHIISSWMAGSVKTAETGYVEFVLSCYEKCEQARIALNKDRINELHCLRVISGLEPADILRTGSYPPDELTNTMVCSWFRRNHPKMVHEAHYNYVVEALKSAAFGSKSSTPTSLMTLGLREINILRHLQKVTECGASRLLKEALYIPEGLDSHVINSWLRDNPPETVPQTHYQFALYEWERQREKQILAESR